MVRGLVLLSGVLGWFEVTNVSFLGSTNVTWSSDDDLPLESVSACRFNESDLVLVGSTSGKNDQRSKVYVASATLEPLDVSIRSAVQLTRGAVEEVDAEGCEIVGQRLLISTESSHQPGISISLLAVGEFDLVTGRAVDSNVTYKVPDDIANNTAEDRGFEGLTATEALPLGSLHLVTTTEAKLHDDPPGYHRLLAWDAHRGGFPNMDYGYDASSVKDEHMLVVELESLDSTLLVLERVVVANQPYSRLYEFDVANSSKQLVFEWTLDGLELMNNQTIDLPVQQFDAMCLFPDGQTLLLISEDQGDDPTHFVALRLHGNIPTPVPSPLPTPIPTPIPTPMPIPAPTQSDGNDDWLWILPLVALCIIAVAYCGCRRRPSPVVTDEADGQIEMAYDIPFASKRDSERRADFTRVSTVDEDDVSGDDSPTYGMPERAGDFV